MTLPIYPLQQVLQIKKDRVEKAEKIVEEKRLALEREQDKLKKIEAERDKVKAHHSDKLTQLRKALDEGTTSDEVLQMKAYLKVVKEKLAKEEEKVKEQQKQVKVAEKALADAREDLRLKRVEEEKIILHKQEWEKQEKIEIARKEASQHDEIGQVIHETQKRKKKE